MINKFLPQLLNRAEVSSRELAQLCELSHETVLVALVTNSGMDHACEVRHDTLFVPGHVAVIAMARHSTRLKKWLAAGTRALPAHLLAD